MEQKNRRITFRLSDSDYQMLMKKCEASKLTQSQFILKAVREEEIIVIPEVKELKTELRRIGNNVNQLMVLMNKGLVQISNLEETRKGIDNIWQSLSSLRKNRKPQKV